MQQTTSGQQSLTPSSLISAPSPSGASSAADESLEDSKSLPGASPNPWPHTPSQMSQGHVRLFWVFEILLESSVLYNCDF